MAMFLLADHEVTVRFLVAAVQMSFYMVKQIGEPI